MEITYSLIEPLIVSQNVDGTKVICEFALPGSQEVVESFGGIKKGKDMASKVTSRVKRSAASQMRMMGSRMIRGVTGSNMVGRTATVAFNTASSEAVRTNLAYDKKDLERAILEAFNRVKDHFHYNEQKGQWGEPPIPPPPVQKSPFQEQMESAPIGNTYDYEIFARILTELAFSDGTISAEEKEFFTSFIPDEVGPMERLIQGDPVSRIECEEVTEKVKETIYQFAWAISLVDFDLDPMEEELLAEYADMFKIADYRSQELILNAKYEVLERAIDPDISRQELFELADKINMTRDDAERCRIGIKKRMG